MSAISLGFPEFVILENDLAGAFVEQLLLDGAGVDDVAGGGAGGGFLVVGGAEVDGDAIS